MCAGRYTCMYMCVKVPPNSWLFYMWPLFMYMYIHMYFYVSTSLHMYAGIHACLCVCEGSSLVILYVAFLMYMHVCNFMYIPVHICMWLHMHVYVCVWRLEDNLRWHPSECCPPLSTPFRLGLWMAWHSPVRSERKDGRTQGSSCLSLPSDGVTWDLLHVYVGSKDQAWVFAFSGSVL